MHNLYFNYYNVIKTYKGIFIHTISTLQSQSTSHMSNVVHYTGISSENNWIIYHLSIFFICECSPPYLKIRRAPRRSLLTGKIGVRRRSFPGHVKQQAGSPKVRRRNRHTPAWQMKLYPPQQTHNAAILLSFDFNIAVISRVPLPCYALRLLPLVRETGDQAMR